MANGIAVGPKKGNVLVNRHVHSKHRFDIYLTKMLEKSFHLMVHPHFRVSVVTENHGNPR